MPHTSMSAVALQVARAAFAIAFAASGCRSATDNDRQELAACSQTYEFGNYGCARVVAAIDGPPSPWPTSYRLDVRAVPARVSSGASVAVAPQPSLGAVPLRLTLRGPPSQAVGDTLSVWVVARMLEDPWPPVVGVPLPVFAADSVLRVVRWAPVGGVPQVDTVRLVLRRP